MLTARVLGFYQRWLSPALHSVSGASGACRFQPTCSEYAAVAIARHGVAPGSLLALGRLLRCNPFSRGGWDPVPGTDAGTICSRCRTDERRHLP